MTFGAELRTYGRLVVTCFLLGSIAVTKQYGAALQQNAGIKGYEKARMQIAKMRKIKAAM